MLSHLQVTQETEDALHACCKVYYLHPDRYVLDYLRRFNLEVVDLSALYEVRRPRLPVYEAMADLVLQAARERPPVALAVYGHPMMFVAPSRMIRDQASQLGMRVKVLPGISALDCLMIDLDFDPGVEGLVMYEANHALLYHPPLNPTVPCLLWQAGALETGLFAPWASRPQRFIRLQEYLLRFYPAEHRVALATSALNPLVDPELIWVAIKDIPDMHASFTSLTTLFIPAASKPVVRDHDLARLLDDPNHLKTITHIEDDRV
jgi:hypothetical protein